MRPCPDNGLIGRLDDGDQLIGGSLSIPRRSDRSVPDAAAMTAAAASGGGREDAAAVPARSEKLGWDVIAVADVIKEDSPQRGPSSCRIWESEVVMLTGDNETDGSGPLGKQAGVDRGDRGRASGRQGER